MIKIRNLSALAFAAIFGLAACGGDGAEGGEGEVVNQDTSVVAGQDTVQQPAVVNTQDTVVSTTTVDTTQGQAQNTDSVAGDTTKAP
jgi:ABC-type glycerol-3-phosphate transport system substrate-binding protein